MISIFFDVSFGLLNNGTNQYNGITINLNSPTASVDFNPIKWNRAGIYKIEIFCKIFLLFFKLSKFRNLFFVVYPKNKI